MKNTVLVVALCVAVVAILFVVQSAHGQQNGVAPPSDVKIINQDDIKSALSAFMPSSKLIDYKLYGDGKGEFTFHITARPGNETFTVLMNQPYDVKHGYIYNSSGVFTGNGSQRLIIETSD